MTHFDDRTRLVGTEAHVNRTIVPIQVQTIKRSVLVDPAGEFLGGMPWDYQIDRRTEPRTDRRATLVPFVGRVLIELGRDLSADDRGQTRPREAIGQGRATKRGRERI